MDDWFDGYPSLRMVVDILQDNHIEAYLVGGAVRDLILKRSHIVDFDFAVPSDGLKVARRIADELNAAFYPLDVERRTGRVVYERPEDSSSQKSYLDFATFRGADLQADLWDRDFSINAMAFGLTPPRQLIDPVQGQTDLKNGRIRAVGANTFQNDPARILRAIRQATDFGFVIEPQTEQWLRQAVAHLTTVSPERQRDELLKLLNTHHPGTAISQLHYFDIILHLLPEVAATTGVEQSPPHHLDVFRHTVAALTAWATLIRTDFSGVVADKWQEQIKQYLSEPLTGDLAVQTVMPMALLLHDTGKPLTRAEQNNSSGQTKVTFIGHEKESATIVRRVLGRLRFSSQAANFVETVVAHHMRPLLLATTANSLSRRAIYRLFRDTSERGFQAGLAVALHAIADHQATYPPGQGQPELERLLGITDKLVEAYFEQHDQVVDPSALLTGHDLIKIFELKEGRLVGVLLKRLKEVQAAGQITDRAGAIAFIKADPDFVAYREDMAHSYQGGN